MPSFTPTQKPSQKSTSASAEGKTSRDPAAQGRFEATPLLWQRALGGRAAPPSTAGIVQRTPEDSRQTEPERVPTGRLQRKCACGGTASDATGECAACRQKRSGRLQTKLTVGAPDDAYEREAERVAGEIAAVPAGAAVTTAPLRIQRVPAPDGDSDGTTTAPASVHRMLAMSGRPLERGLRRDMESRFEQDFRDVRVHTGPEANRSARDVQAKAYTVGRHIGFGDGQFDPSTPDGRRLLAHELTHVIQQSGSRPGEVVQRDGTANKTAPPKLPVIWQGYGLNVSQRDEIQWQVYAPYIGISDDSPHLSVYLLVVLTAEKRAGLTAEELAAECTAPLFEAVDLPLQNNGQDLMGYLAGVFTVNSNQPSLYIGIPETTIRKQFKGDEFDPYWRKLTNSVVAQAGSKVPELASSSLTLATANIPDHRVYGEPDGKDGKDGKKSKQAPPPKWVTAKKKAFDATLAKLRNQTRDRPKDLPDRLVLWHNERDDAWFLNVWMYLDVQGKNKTVQAVRLQENESAEDLLARVREAGKGALAKSAAEEEQRRQKAMPAWAIQLKQKLEQRLHQATGGKPADDAPDRLSLAYGKSGTSVPGQSATEGEVPDQVLLQVWIEIGKKSLGNSGSVPISPTTDIEQLLAFVRQLAAVLRQNEATPQGTAVSPWEKSDHLSLPPFDAKILAMDLQGNHVTVEGARNRFSMFLDFNKQYGAGPGEDLFIASKLFSQAIFFRWKVFPVPLALMASGPDGQPLPWDQQWKFLYEHYNPGTTASGDEIAATHTAGAVPLPATEPVYDEKGDMNTRVELKGAPGDYLVYCETHHRPIGESGLRRVSSFAYYPVRTRSVDSLTTPMVTQTTAAITAADANLKTLDEALAAENLDEHRKKLLLAARASTQTQRDVLETKETRGLGETTTAEIRDGTARLATVRRLKATLPGILALAKANAAAGVEPSAPSKLLENEPELLNVYWQLIREGKTAASYELELEEQLKELRGVNARAVKFGEDFKSDEGTCVYSPEAVFLSEVDGHMYPLVLMVGEAPSKQPGLRAYVVSDVTTDQTAKRYFGYSAKAGSAGHIEAIDNAFENFGEDATYGEGWIAVRMPRGPREECRELHRQEIKTYRSKEGIIEKVWTALGFLAAAVGIAALVATGFGAVVLGVLGAVLSAAVAAHNISERSARHTLAFDAEMGMDLLSILPVGELVALREFSSLSSAARGIEGFERLGRFIAVYRVAQTATGFALIPFKAVQDIDKIRGLHLPKDQEDAMIREVWAGAVQNGLMFLVQVGASHMMAGGHGVVPIAEERASLHQQAELVSLEQTEHYRSMQDKGWVDEHGNWTDKAPESVRRKLAEPAGGEPTVHGEPPFDPAHPDAHPAVAKPDAQLVEAAHQGVERVERHEVRVEGEVPGTRHANLGDGHEIVEVQTEGGGIGCEYHSNNRVPVLCPTSMGGPAKPPGEPATPAKGIPDAPGVADHPEVSGTGGPTAHPAAGSPGAAVPTAELHPQTLIAARQQERAALTRRENLATGIESSQLTNVKVGESIQKREALMAAYQKSHPGAGPQDPTLQQHQQRLNELHADYRRRKNEIAGARREIATLEGQLAGLAEIKTRYAASKPWRKVSLADEVRGGLVGELEMSTVMQGEGLEPVGNTVRADNIVIPEDFETAVENWRGKNGIDGIYRRPHPDKPGKFQYWIGESKTTGTPGTREPTGTRGKLTQMKTGERQQSDLWIRDRLDSSGLSPGEARDIKEALLAGDVKKFYAETDGNGTRLYQVTNVAESETDVRIGGRVTF